MKRLTYFFLLCGLGLSNAAQPPDRIVVNFIQPEQFKDVGLSGSSTDRIRQSVLDSLRDYLLYLANNKLPANTRLSINILDIDMAGSYEPWRTPNQTNVRFIRDIYPPKIKLRYSWQDAQGKTLESKDEVLSNLAYLQLADPGYVANDPLRYEKTLLRRWFEQRFVGTKSD